MGQLYIAFHEMLGYDKIRALGGQDVPAGTINHKVRFIITCVIVASVVQNAYMQYYDPEYEEKTPKEQADKETDRLMRMLPDQWWDQIIIFSSEDVAAHQGLFDVLPEEHPPFP